MTVLVAGHNFLAFFNSGIKIASFAMELKRKQRKVK